jgi:glycosyltransferase involved in cell wall biosynthesis
VGGDRRRGGDGRLDGRLLPALGGAAHARARRARSGGGRPELRILVVSGIWPPDVGGPASHAPEVAEFLLARGHEVDVVVTADSEPAPEPYGVHWISRGRPPGVRHAVGLSSIARRAAASDVVYSTGMLGRSALGSRLARTPIVMKLTADPAFERARRWGLWHGSLEDFQTRAPATTRPLRLARDRDVKRAAHVVMPSEYLRRLALGWGVPPERATVLRNPTPPLPEFRPRDDLRAGLGLDGPALAFAGRLTAQKSLDVGIEASRRAGVALLIAGDGPDRAALEQLGHARFLGPLPRQGVLELFLAADASLLSSSWENFPHTVVEALAVGTPVIATDTGGVAEVVRDGENGLLVEPGDVAKLSVAIDRFFADAALAQRLRANAAGSVAEYAADRVYGRLETILEDAAGR